MASAWFNGAMEPAEVMRAYGSAWERGEPEAANRYEVDEFFG